MAAPTRIVGGPPNGREELLERDILEHEAATTAYLIAANAEFVAEGKVSAPDLERLRERTAHAYQEMMFRARSLVICVPHTRRSLIKLVQYLDDQSGCKSIPETMNGKPWMKVFLHSLRLALRRMGRELDPVSE